MTTRTLDEAVLSKWIGRTQSITDTIAISQAKFMHATLDGPGEFAETHLPPLWHWIYFLEASPQSKLGRDGHPALGEFLPPVDLPRRMWAGGRINFHEPIQFGEELIKTSTVKSISIKEGRSGKLCFVTVVHEIHSTNGDLRLSEEHDIVYREEPSLDAPAAKPQPTPDDGEFSKPISPSSTLLFRYSALTFNGHRIHYDRDYARDIEHYAGLVFHGPLTATLLAQLAADNFKRPLKTFEFRAVSPLFDTEDFSIFGRLDEQGHGTFWAQTPQGHLAMTAKATA